jgi:Zn-dependent protease
MRLPHAAQTANPPKAASAHGGSWSWHIGSLFGIEVRVHATFLILLGWVAMSHLMAGHAVAMAASGVVYILAVFAIVVLHELGHALTARRFGIRTRDITLLPIGGVARLERMPSKPSQEFLVAIAGPAVNFVLALLLFATLVAMGAIQDTTRWTLVGGPFLAKLMWTNLALGAFNLIPAFPMDGGRVLRALLAMRTSYLRATDIAALVGQGLALAFGLVGLFVNPFLVFIALFVWIGAQGEARMAHVHAALAGVPVAEALVTRLVAVSPDEPVSSVAQHMLAGFQDDVPVLDRDRLAGVVYREDVLKAALEGNTNTPVASIMQRNPDVVGESESLDAAFERLQASGRRSIPVVRGDELIGVLPVENVAYVLQVRERQRAQMAHA